MSKEFLENETVKIDFPDGHHVEVKQELEQLDRDFINNRMVLGDGVVQAPADGKAPAKGAEIKLNLGKLALLSRAIVAWDFKDDQGQPVPITEANISRLRQRYRNVILARLDDLYMAAETWEKN